MDDLTRARAFFAGDRFATDAGMVVDAVADRYARCSVTLDARHRNSLGGVMGGAIFTLADFAFAVATNWQGMPTVSVDADVRFLSAAKGEALTAEAKCIRDGRTTCCYQITVMDGARPIALVTVTGMHVGKE